MKLYKSILTLTLLLCAIGKSWGETVTLDAKDGNIEDYNGKTIDITIKNRTYQANCWVVVCYPFDVTKAMLDANFTSGYAVEEYSSMSIDGKFTFTIFDLTSKSIPAGTPFLLKSKVEVNTVAFNNVTINTTLHNVTHTNGSYSGTLHGCYSKPALWQFQKGNTYSGCLFISAQETLTGPYSSPLNDDTDVLRFTNGYFSFSDGVSTSLNIETVTIGGSDNNGDNTGGGNNTGGGGSTTGMTLEQKIANKAQLTNVPTIYFDIPDAEGKEINNVLDAKKEYHTATIQVVDKTEGGLDEFTDYVQIKVRGNSTAKENKKPYRLKFAKEITDASGNVIANCKKHDMLGKGYSKRNWALLANYLDYTMVRNALTNKIGELVGMPFCPGYKFADVVINGEYRGTYQITDHIEADVDRVNVNEDTGWYLESSRGDMVEAPSVSAQSLMMSIKNPEPKTEEETATLKKQIEDWFKPVDDLFCIYNGTFDINTFKDPVNGWRKYWDEESLVNFYIGINLTGDYDGFMTVKMYRDLNKKLKFGPLWDKDLAFGNYSADNGKILSEDQQTGSYFSSYVKKLWLDPVFVKKVHDKLNTLVANGLATTLKDNVDELVALTAQTEAINRTKWGLGGSWTLSFNTREDAVAQLKGYIDQHVAWFQTTINNRYEELGGANIVDNSIPGDDFKDGSSSGEDDSTFDPITTIEFTSATGGHKIPASAFSSKATKVEITFSVPNESFWGFYGYNGSQWNAKNFNSVNNEITITIEDPTDIITIAKNGITFELQSNSSSLSTAKLTISVINTMPENPDTDEPATHAQLTNLPTIYLNATTIGNEWAGATLEVFDKDNKLTQGTEWTNSAVEVQYQGSGDNTSKNSYRLKFGSKTKLLASGKFKQWVLLANDDDPTMTNNALAKVLGDAIGMPWTPGYEFVDLYVNDKYMGTYQVTDRIKAEEGRSLVTGGNKDNDWQVRFNDNNELQEDGTSDYITANGINVIYKNPDPSDLTAEQVNTLRTDLSTYFNTVFAKNDGTYPNFAENIDKQQLINWYIAQEILGVYKGFSSIEAYRSITATAADNLLHFGPLWDSEKGFGNTGSAPAIDMSDLNTKDSYKGLMTKYAAFDKMKDIFTWLWTEDWFKSGVKATWTSLYTDKKIASLLKSKANELSTLLAESQAKNLTTWPNSLEYNNSTNSKYSNYAAAITALTSFIDKRVEYLNTKFEELTAEACEHTYNKGKCVDNADGTHSPLCDNCDFVDSSVKETHTLVARNNNPYCVVCSFSETASIIGGATDNTPVYRIHESEKATDVKYISANSNVAANGNKIYISDQPITDGTSSLTNIVWPRSEDGEYIAKNIAFTDGNYKYDQEINIHAEEVTYTRSMTSSWGTVCLPFKIASCDDYTLYEISRAYVNDEDNTGTLIFEKINSASGLQPVVFKKNTSENEVVFRGVPQNKGDIDDGLVTVKKSKKFGNEKTIFPTDVQNSGTWELYGDVKQDVKFNVKSEEYAGKEIYYIASNKFWHATGDVNMKTFRAAFVFTPAYHGTDTEAAKSFSISIDDNSTTSISKMNVKNHLAIFIESDGVTLSSDKPVQVTISTIGGSAVNRITLKADEQRHVSLPKGLYVINNTKVSVK